MITKIIRSYTAVYNIMSINLRSVSTLLGHRAGVKTLNNKNIEKEPICHWVQKQIICNTKQYDSAIPISLGFHLMTHLHDMDNKSHR